MLGAISNFAKCNSCYMVSRPWFLQVWRYFELAGYYLPRTLKSFQKLLSHNPQAKTIFQIITALSSRPMFDCLHLWTYGYRWRFIKQSSTSDADPSRLGSSILQTSLRSPHRTREPRALPVNPHTVTPAPSDKKMAKAKNVNKSISRDKFVVSN